MSKNVKRLIPFFVLFLLIVFVYIFNLHQKFTLDWIRQEEQGLFNFVQAHPILSPLVFVGAYILSVCLIIPDSTILILIGGLVFPFPLAFLYSAFSETIGAIIFFSIFKRLFKTSFFKDKFSYVSRFRKRFRRNEMSYLLFLRFSHIFPFWLTNVTASYFRVSYWTFIWTCFVGILPLTYILTDAGNSLSFLFAQKTDLTISDIFTIQVKISLFALGLLSLIPIVYKKFKKRKK